MTLHPSFKKDTFYPSSSHPFQRAHIHLELLAGRVESSIIDAYSRTYQGFSQLGHFVQFQVMDNEAPKKGLRQHFISSDIKYEFVPPFTKRSNKAERAIQTFKRHFISILAGTHLSFSINLWHELILQAEITLNITMMRAFADQPNISAYHGIHRKPYDFLSHPLAPCGTLIILHNSIRETWDYFRHIGFYLGPAASHYRSYRCLVQETNAIRISDSIILFRAPLVEPGASRFDQLLALTEKLAAVADATTVDDSRAQLQEVLQLLRTFLASDHERNPSASPTPTSGPTRHRPSSDTGGDIIGWHFKENSLGDCVVLATNTFLDENNIQWNTLQISCSKHPEESNVFKVSEIRTPRQICPLPTSQAGICKTNRIQLAKQNRIYLYARICKENGATIPTPVSSSRPPPTQNTRRLHRPIV
jgi:hypothetical protein